MRFRFVGRQIKTWEKSGSWRKTEEIEKFLAVFASVFSADFFFLLPHSLLDLFSPFSLLLPAKAPFIWCANLWSSLIAKAGPKLMQPAHLCTRRKERANEADIRKESPQNCSMFTGRFSKYKKQKLLCIERILFWSVDFIDNLTTS